MYKVSARYGQVRSGLGLLLLEVYLELLSRKNENVAETSVKLVVSVSFFRLNGNCERMTKGSAATVPKAVAAKPIMITI